MPGAEGRLCERLFCREGIVHNRVRSRQRAVQTRDGIRRVEFAEVRSNLPAWLVAADTNDALVFQLVRYVRILWINIRGKREDLRRLLVADKVAAIDQLARMSVDLYDVKTEGVGRELRDLPYQTIAVACRINAEHWLEL